MMGFSAALTVVDSAYNSCQIPKRIKYRHVTRELSVYTLYIRFLVVYSGTSDEPELCSINTHCCY